ncbi:MAG: DNA translocase FtsK [Planctomycetes bacterium]|nr:DNA translocase FtsK [Planctomycetota bacterium]
MPVSQVVRWVHRRDPALPYFPNLPHRAAWRTIEVMANRRRHPDMSKQPEPAVEPPVRSARRGVDVVALTLCATGLFLAFSLFSQTAPEHFTPPATAPEYAITDHVGSGLFEALGLAAYGFLAAWVFLACTRFTRPSWFRFTRLTMGWALLIAGAAIALDRFSPKVEGPLTGPGGSIGAAGAVWLEQSFPTFWWTLPLSVGLVFGLYLAAEFVVRAIARGVTATIRFIFATIEWLLLRISDALNLIANGLKRVALPISRHLHPERFPIPMAIITRPETGTSGLLNIPIHHHQRPVDSKPELTVYPPRITTPKKEEVPVEIERPYDLPSLDLLDEPIAIKLDNEDGRLRDVATHLEKACADFGLVVKVVGIHTGPVITQFEISLDTGMRVSKITSLSDDLALHLKVPSVRIVAPIPGKNTVGIEVPNEHRAVVRMKELALAGNAKIAKSKLPLLLGKDSEGRPLIHDLADMPHLLIAGRTGTGKSVCLNSIILSLLMTRRPDECKLIMIDPKQVELAEYGRLPHLMHPVVTDNKKAEAILSWAVDKMEERYEILRRARVRNIASYNELPHDEILRRVKPVDEEEEERVPAHMPYIVIVVDEVGDLMMAMKKEVEGHIIRLAQKSRAAGIHLILTTQRPTVDVITGLIKSNLPARVCFQVADRSNSRVVLDEMGAEKLLGKGDMLFLQPNTSTIVRAQGAFASDAEILRIVGKLEVENPNYDSELLGLQQKDGPGKGGMMEAIRKRDELYEEAIEIVIREGRGSVSLLQRALGIGYGRSARLVDYMAEDGIVGNYNGAQAREVLFTMDQWNEMKNGGADSLAESA